MSKTTSYRTKSGTGGWLITGLGTVLVLIGIIVLTQRHDPLPTLTVEFVVVAASSAGLMYGGYRLATGDYDADELWRTVRWCFLGVVAFSVLVGWFVLYQQLEGNNVVGSLFLLTTVAAVGGVVGLSLGVYNIDRGRLSHGEDLLEVEHEQTDSDEMADEPAVDEATPPTVVSAATAADAATPEDATRESILLHYLATTERDYVTLETLALEIARREADGVEMVDDPNTRKRLAISLHHTTLPKLDDAGRLRYDPINRLVVCTSDDESSRSAR